jgi:hypothetical protein
VKFLKNSVVIILLAVFVFNTMGYFIAFQTIQHQVKKEAKRSILNKMNDSFYLKKVFTEEAFNKIDWHDDGKEFVLNNELYDVVKIEKNKGDFIVYCIDDKKETQLFANLNEHIQQHATTNTSSKSSKKIADNVVKLFYENKASIEALIFSSNICYSFSNYPLQFPNIETSNPPPELLA